MANFLDPLDQEEMNFQSAVPGFSIADLNKRSSTRDDELNAILNAPPAPMAPTPAVSAPMAEITPEPAAPQEPTGPSEIGRLLAFLKPEQSSMDVSGTNIAKGGTALDEAIAARDEEIKSNRIGMAGQTIADALAPGTGKIGNEFYEQGIKLADRKVEDYKKKVENQKNDPTSEYSSGLREFAKKFGITVPDNVSGETMDKLLPYVSRAYDSDLDNKARVLSIVEGRKGKAEEKEEANKEKLTDSLRKEIDRKTQKLTEQYDNKSQFNDLLDEYVKNYDKLGSRGFQDLALRYGFIKSRDNTAVREGELKILSAAGSIPAKLKRSLSQAVSGKSLTKADLQELKNINESEMGSAAKSFQEGIAAQVNRAKGKGLDLNDIISRQDILTAPKKEKSGEKNKTPVKKEYSASRNQTRITYSDGTTEVLDGKK